LATIYILFFVHCLYDSVYAGIRGGLFGIKENISTLSYEITGGRLIPNEGYFTFPSSLVNTKTGENVRAEITEIVVFLKQLPDNAPFYIKTLKITRVFFLFTFFIFFIWIPFIARKIMKSISKKDFYTINNINKIRRISYIILIMFFLLFIANFCQYQLTRFYVQLETYRFTLFDYNYSLLFLGLTILILSEILRYTTAIKEEQDLTV
jgi:hypothetical protein